MRKAFILIFVFFGIILLLSVLSIAQVAFESEKTFLIVTTDSNIPDVQKLLIEKVSQSVENVGVKLSNDFLITVAEKKAKIDRNNQSIKEYEEKIIEWEQINEQLKKDLKEIEKLGLKVD